MELVQATRFNRVVGNIFEKLASSFPLTIQLDASAAGFDVVGGYNTIEGEQIHVPPSEDELFFGGCVHWLIEEGYVRVSKSWEVQFRGAVLTQKALALTNLEPMVLKRGAY